MPACTIRPLAPDDRAQWADLWRAYLAFYETELPEAQYALTWSRLMAEDDQPHGFCAVEEDGRLIGITHYLFHRHSWTEAEACYLQDLFVAQSARGTGAGRALIEAVYAAADARGASQTYWLTQDFNETARRLYDRIAVLTPFVKYKRP